MTDYCESIDIFLRAHAINRRILRLLGLYLLCPRSTDCDVLLLRSLAASWIGWHDTDERILIRCARRARRASAFAEIGGTA